MMLPPQYKNEAAIGLPFPPFLRSVNVTRAVTGSYFDERDPNSSLCDVRLHLIAELPDELVRDHKDEDRRSLNGLCDVWNGHLQRGNSDKVRVL